eukprot:TRINITY_DN2781_c0_g1_i1.p1 TRINITY_DN2781_c0_g1~~TRINITY_DN2781_c0_g1_i1.p1  ORF type:complete len:317 (+),score=43.01 TRINITY_DN2781_c0_g1_i1:99-1049(+)
MEDSIRKRPRIDITTGYQFHLNKDIVGEGTFGIVYRAKDKISQQPVAIKKFKPTKEGEGISLTAYREIMLLRELNHENIIRVKNVIVSPHERSLSLVMEYAEYDLSEIIRFHLKQLRQPLSPYCIKSLMWQLLNGMHFLHTNWICHRDLKPSNILLMTDGPEQGVVKIADFGLARIFQSPLRPLSENGVVVTIWYRAPELLLGSKHYTKAVDIWAIGCIFAELLTRLPLFPGMEKETKQPHLFQDIQLDKIFGVLGRPSEQDCLISYLCPIGKLDLPRNGKELSSRRDGMLTNLTTAMSFSQLPGEIPSCLIFYAR